MTNIIITINRECGSGGGEIARRLGERLGIKVYNRVMLDDIARQFDMSVENIERVKAQKTSWLYQRDRNFHARFYRCWRSMRSRSAVRRLSSSWRSLAALRERPAGGCGL